MPLYIQSPHLSEPNVTVAGGSEKPILMDLKIYISGLTPGNWYRLQQYTDIADWPTDSDFLNGNKYWQYEFRAVETTFFVDSSLDPYHYVGAMDAVSNGVSYYACFDVTETKLAEEA